MPTAEKVAMDGMGIREYKTAGNDFLRDIKDKESSVDELTMVWQLNSSK